LVYFGTFGIFWDIWYILGHLVYFGTFGIFWDIWYILGHLVHFVILRYISPVLVCYTMKNRAILVGARVTRWVFEDKN
jgi:hypothetical protein